MFEMSYSRKDHRRPSLTRRRDRIGIALRAARLDNRRNSRIGPDFDTVRHRIEGVGSHNGAFGTVAGSFHRQKTGVDP